MEEGEDKVEEEESVEQEAGLQQSCNECQQGFLSNMFPIRESCPSGRICTPGVWSPSQCSVLVHKPYYSL